MRQKGKGFIYDKQCFKKNERKKNIYQFDNGKIKDFTMYSTVLVT